MKKTRFKTTATMLVLVCAFFLLLCCDTYCATEKIELNETNGREILDLIFKQRPDLQLAVSGKFYETRFDSDPNPKNTIEADFETTLSLDSSDLVRIDYKNWKQNTGKNSSILDSSVIQRNFSISNNGEYWTEYESALGINSEPLPRKKAIIFSGYPSSVSERGFSTYLALIPGRLLVSEKGQVPLLKLLEQGSRSTSISWETKEGDLIITLNNSCTTEKIRLSKAKNFALVSHERELNKCSDGKVVFDNIVVKSYINVAELNLWIPKVAIRSQGIGTTKSVEQKIEISGFKVSKGLDNKKYSIDIPEGSMLTDQRLGVTITTGKDSEIIFDENRNVKK